jgi:hypothetical protein
MAVIINQYYQAGVYRNNGTISLLNPAITMALVSKDYTPDLDLHTLWADVSANEVVAGSGYTTGGAALANLSLVRTGPLTTWDADDLTWAALTKTFKYGIIYLNDTVGGVVKPLIAVVDFDDTTTIAEVTSGGTDFVFQPSLSGLLVFGPDTTICGA